MSIRSQYQWHEATDGFQFQIRHADHRRLKTRVDGERRRVIDDVDNVGIALALGATAHEIREADRRAGRGTHRWWDALPVQL